MKFKTTKKEIQSNYQKIIKVGYCGLQTLLNCKSPIAYITRREGWACDIYEISSTVCISTGYAPFGNVVSQYDVNQKYEKKAEAVWYDYCRPFDERKEALNEMLKDYIKEVVG